MTVYIDADSCPIQIREIVSRAAKRLEVKAVFVANRKIPFTENNMTEMLVVAKGEGVADKYIVDHAVKGDLVITRDIPLAADLLLSDVTVINDRGNQFSNENIRERLSVRGIMKNFREYGIANEKHSRFSLGDVQKFAASFDRELTKLSKFNLNTEK